ncbi:putative polyketide synthase [Xylaria bambusicola]|uniref:putative polyketide synthase n=1 Tax=Xylaria bambusicola TaxID=326684 RepID=UPI0020088DB5|nr:putative polyketide synthase [Xylaria bambusicola]KAI0508529.1 putative polyketide synthase [Xylaria bambusicola]
MPLIKEDNSTLEPIAIVGMACRLPGDIDGASKFWDMLIEQRSVRTPRVPSNRFNIDAHFHPDLARPGSFTALGGYFLDGNLEDFDCTFFNITPVEAQWLDPQQRKMLEVCYECFENAGLRLDQVAGSNTAVYAATFTSDYQQMSIFDRDFRHNYAATGVDVGIISNRINNAFNLNGPSFTINTACSSSVYAIHSACHSLRSRDCEAALVGGVNLILIVDQHMNTAKLGVLSPTSECHTFDESADGYGRAEGVGAIYLKRLSDAIRDRDVIRGVIRSSAVNTNGKVEGMGITFPNVLGQERVLRHAYERANLDPNRTAYLECHGTGTPSGDPIEVRAVANGMNDSRSLEKPLILGAVKSNIGHSEAASGIFATMKVALSTEKSKIPGVHGFRKLNPNIKDKEWNIKIATELMEWPEGFDERRGSVSSFGYGGTNAHLVIESIETLCPWYEHGHPKVSAKYSYDLGDRPFLITMSAHDRKTLTNNIRSHQPIAGEYHLPDLAYTLNCRRSRFAERGYTIAFPGREPESFELDSFRFGSVASDPSKVGFVFTGQGAQWARMGYEAMQFFPQFAETIESLDRVLLRASPRPTWSLKALLSCPEESSNVGEAEISQPACTAIQIAIVDLFAAWGIDPAVTIGHSSGEIAAAYAAGRISAPEAILAAYLRGVAVKIAAPVGTMLAVGLGVDEVEDYVPEEFAEGITVACENSPKSVTLSGAFGDIAVIQDILEETKVFYRELKTGRAYHSPHMNSVAPVYAELYEKSHKALTAADLAWRRQPAPMISSVSGQELDSADLGISYWCDNLQNRVLFNTAAQLLGRDDNYSDVSIMVEIGPHPALSGPLKQVYTEEGFKKKDNIATFVRGSDSAVALLRTMGELYVRGIDVDFQSINNIGEAPSSPLDFVHSNKKYSAPRYLPDLPPYQWNYETKYWHEPREVQELRKTRYPRHDILGRRIFGLSPQGSTWKNVLRQRDLPWLKDHTLGSDAVFPAAGYVCMVMEALMQQLDLDLEAVESMVLRGVRMNKALVIPDSDGGVETHTRLQQAANNWYTFSVESVNQDGQWNLHASGKIRQMNFNISAKSSGNQYNFAQLHQQVPGKSWYRSFDRVGFHYGANFQTMDQVRSNGKDRVAAASIRVQTECGSMKEESRYAIHPSTIDGCLHTVIAAVHRGLHKEMPWGVVPLEIEQITVNIPKASDVNTYGDCKTWVVKTWDRYFETNAELFGSSSNHILEIKNLKLVIYDAAVPKTLETRAKQPYRRIVWKPAPSEASSLHTNGDIENSSVELISASGKSKLADYLGSECISISEYVLKPSHQGPIIVDDTDGAILSSPTTKTFGILKSLLGSARPIVWLTRGVNEGDCVEGGIAQAFLRVARSEAAAARIILLDADGKVSTHIVASRLQHYCRVAVLLEPDQDNEFWLTENGDVLVARIEVNNTLNNLLNGGESYKTLPISAKHHEALILGNEVIFEETKSPEQALDSLQVEIQILSTEINKSDLITHAGDYGRVRLVTGTVLRVGKDVDEKLQGQMVLACAKTAYALQTRVVSETFVSIDSSFLQPKIMASLATFYKAVDALRVAGIEAGDSVLLLPGPPDFLDAILALGSHIGFQVTRVGDDETCVERFVESQKCPKFVIAGGLSPLIQEIWSRLPQGCNLVLSDVNLSEPLDPRPFARGVTLNICGMVNFYENSCTQGIVESLIETRDILLSPTKAIAMPSQLPLDIEDLSNLEEARGKLPNVGSNAVQIRYNQSRIKSRKRRPQVQFDSDAAYILVGCLGGLGRSLTTWMLENGCRNFVFLSRSGADKPEAKAVVKRLQQAGAEVHIFCVDASHENDVARVIAEVSSTTLIKGVIHAAMVLCDNLLHSMTLEQYSQALKPKMQAAVALHNALGMRDLDFFIMTSSLSAVLGNPGQANYCAGNGFLDFLALYRLKRGLAACSIALPMVENVGVVAENASIAGALTRQNPFSIDEREMILAFEAAILQGQDQTRDKNTIGDAQLILGLEPEAVMAAMQASESDMSNAYWVTDARLTPFRSDLQQLLEASHTSPGGGSTSHRGTMTSASLVGKSRTEVLNLVGSHIANRTARILGMDSEKFQLDGISVARQGVDSMIGVELQTWLFKEFDVQVSVQVLSNPSTTFRSLASTVAEHLYVAA